MKRSIIAAAVFSSFFMSAGVFAADVDTGTLTIKGNIAESPCKFEAGGDSVSIIMPTVPTTVFEGKAKYSTYDDAVGVTSSMLKISCPKEVAGVKLSLITNDKITGNDKAIASSNDTVAYNLGGSMVAVASAVLSVLIILFGEITPKTMATLHAEKMSLRYAPAINLYIKVMTPFVFIINTLSDIILRILHIDPNAGNKQMTESELRTIVDVSHESGVIESDEKEMIYNVFDLGDAKAKDVMVPRVHVTFAEVNATYDELIDSFSEDKFTRLPIFEDTTDNVVGTINMKDLLLYDKEKEFHIRDFMREAYFTYEYKNISELLVEMRQASFNIAIVLDEYGETSGLITLEDILEEIVGEIHDEYDENEEDFIKQVGERDYIVEGSTNLDDLNDRLDLDLTSEEYDSVGGFIIEHLDRLPEIGDGVTTEDDIHLVVEKLDKNRIESVHLYLPEPKPEDEEGDED